MTLLPETHAPDDAYQALRAQFSEQEQVMHILVIVAINGWKLTHIFARKMSRIVRYGFISGLPGFVTIEGDDRLQTTALQIEDGKIVAIYVMRNPDKLRHLGGHAVH